MRIAILGAGGGLGRNVVDAAIAAGHEVVALVRDAKRADLPAGVRTVLGDATIADDVARATEGSGAAMYCVNPPLETWLTTFRPLLDAAIEGVKRGGARLVFPANVWIYGRGGAGPVDEARAASPTSKRGWLRAELEQRIRDAGIRYALLRLPEFYGPSVTTLTARPFRAAMTGKRAVWPGRLDAPIELVYMPDAARAMVELGVGPGCDADVFHLPGAPTTARAFIEQVYVASGAKPRVSRVPPWVLRVAGVFDGTLRAVADIGHLWTHPILLDGAKYSARFGAIPRTPLADAIVATLAWHRARPELRLQG